MDRLQIIDTTGIPTQFLDDGKFFFDLGQGFLFEETERAEELTDVNKLKASAVLGFPIPYSPKNLIVLESFRNPNVLNFNYRPIEVVAISGDRVLRQNLLVVKDFSDLDREFEVELLDERDFWPQAAKELYLNSLDFGNFVWNEFNVKAVWNAGVHIQSLRDFYLPLAHYGRFYSGTNQTQPEDFRPWFSPIGIMRKAFKELGWTVESPLFDLTEFKAVWTYIMGNEVVYDNQGDSLAIEVAKTQQQGFPGFNAPFAQQLNRLNHIRLFFESEVSDPLNRHHLLDNPDGLPPQVSYFQHFDEVPTLYEFSFKGDIGNAFPHRVKFDIVVWLRNKNEPIDRISDILIPATDSRTIDVSFRALLFAGDDIYFTFSAIKNVDTDDAVILVTEPGFSLSMRPIDKRVYLGETAPLNAFIDPKITFLDYFKGILHLGDFKVITDYVEKKVSIFPTIEGKYLQDDYELEGFIDSGTAKSLPGKLVADSYSGVLPQRRKKRYLRVRFKESTCAYIEREELEKETPLYSKIIDFGDGDENEIEDDENPFFEPTADVVINRIPMPALWDNTNGNISWNIAPRIAVFNTYGTVYDSNDTDNFVTLTYLFTLQDRIPCISQNFQGWIDLGDGPERAPRAIVYTDDLRDKTYFDFWKWSIRELIYGPIVRFQSVMTKSDYNTLSFRDRIYVQYKEIPIVGRLLEKSNQLVGDENTVEVQIKPEPTNVELEP